MAEHQHQLFDPEPMPWEADDSIHSRVASVVFRAPPHGPLDYIVPDHLHELVVAGKRVRAPIGSRNRMTQGYCVSVDDRVIQTHKYKEIDRVTDESPLLRPSMLRLTEWISDYYMCPWGQVLEAVLPAGVRGQAGSREVTLLHVPTNVASRITQLKLPLKQAEALRFLIASPEPLTAQQVAAGIKSSTSPVLALHKKGLLEAQVRRVDQFTCDVSSEERQKPFLLTAEQQLALNAIVANLESQTYQTTLVHGITGSGKTEVYLQAIDRVISFGRQAIVLVPEISLTPQTVFRFRSRLDRVAVLHSHLSPAERHWHWKQIASGQMQVVVGARSAIFAPTPHLGLIVLDEEHDSSFKQDSAPRYHARDVAVRRAQLEKIPLVLGSATPSLESWHQAQTGGYQLVSMRSRVERLMLPEVTTVDMREAYQDRHHRGPISRQLHQGVARALQEQGQVILLLNRRGFSTQIQCPACGHVLRCDACDIALTHHREDEKAICHYCDYQTSAPTRCPECSFDGIRYSGLGTQRLEAEIRARFPDVETLRMDSDTMQRPGSHEAALNRFRSGDVRILLGTQMIAKGLDFPNVTLVGVINADTSLHLPDFRAAERTFQLVTQVAGRTGRGKKGGRVLVQTFEPDNLAIRAAAEHDFIRFATHELPTRREFGYPPYTSMVRIIIRSARESLARMFADQLGESLRTDNGEPRKGVRILGPAPSPISKLHGKFRFHIQLHAATSDTLQAVVTEAMSLTKTPKEVQWAIDVDPYGML